MEHVLLPHKKGDTFPGELFTMYEVIDEVQVPIPLTDVEICMDLRVDPLKPIALRLCNYVIENPTFPVGTLSIVEGVPGAWQIDKQTIDIKAVTYMYDVEFRFPTEPKTIQTLINGTWQHTQDVTHD